MLLHAHDPGTLRLLVIDDDEIDRGHVRRALSKLSPRARVNIEEARDGQEARVRVAEQRFDCILLDYLLPGATAETLLPVLAAAQPDAPVIVLTGCGDETIAVELMKAGAADYLPKDGLDPNRLWAAIRHAVALRVAQRSTERLELARRRRASQLRALVEAAPSISGSLSTEDLARTAADSARRVLGARAAYAAIDSPDGDVAIASTAADAKRSLGDVEAWRAASRGLTRAFEPARVTLPGGHAALVLALRARSGVSGVLGVTEPDDGAEPEASPQLLIQLAQLVSVALANGSLMRELSRAVRVRDEVLAVVSHDLRAPLNNIRLGVELLRDNIAAEDAPVLARLDSSVQHMARLVEDLVDLARVEGRTLDLSIELERADALLDSVAQLAAPLAANAHVQLEVRPAPADLRARVDRHRMLQVLTNLLGNAIKFTPPGGRIELRVERAGDDACFVVADTGRGIDPADREHVFTRFFRSHERRGRGLGLGLGLHIAKGIVDAHGGRIWFDSVPGQGTTFYVCVPSGEGTNLEEAVGLV